MRNILLILIISNAACNTLGVCGETGVETRHRACVDVGTSPAEIAEIELLFDVAIEQIAARHPEDVGSKKKLTQKINDELIDVIIKEDLPETQYQEMENKQVVAQTEVQFSRITLVWDDTVDNVFETSLAHELMHMILGIHGVDTSKHLYKDYFLNITDLNNIPWDALEYQVGTGACVQAGVDLKDCFYSGLLPFKK